MTTLPFHRRTYKTLIYALTKEGSVECNPLGSNGYPQQPITDEGHCDFVGAVFKHTGIPLEELTSDWWERRVDLCKRAGVNLAVIEALYELEPHEPPYMKSAQSFINYLAGCLK